MAAVFNLNWEPNINSKVVAQRAYYRQKSLGGSFSDEGFDPPNDLPTTASNVSISDLLYNTVYQFQIANICNNSDEPVFNSNGVIDAIIFNCEPANITIRYDSVTVYLSAVPQDITKVKFLLYNENDALLASNTVNISDNYAETEFINLDSETVYIIKTQYYAVVNGVEIQSNCTVDNSRVFQTEEYPACTMPTNLSVVAVNI